MWNLKQKIMRTRNYLMILTFLFGFFAVVSCQDNNRQAEEPETNEYDADGVVETDRMDENVMDRTGNTVSDRLAEEEETSTFTAGMTRAELRDDFSEGEGPFTIFAPTNVAYEKLQGEERAEFEDPEMAGAGTNYHVVERYLPSDSLRQSLNDVGGEMELITMQGERIVATMQGNDIVLRDGRGNTATVTETDKEAVNGIVHVIDGVLRPLDITRNDAMILEDVSENNPNQ